MIKKTIPVVGMACSACSAHVEKKLNSLEGISSAAVSLAGRSALVEYDPEVISLEKMKEAVNSIGFDLVIEEDRSAVEIERQSYRLLRRKMLLSWVFALLVMAISMGWLRLFKEADTSVSRSFANQVCLLLSLANMLYPGRGGFLSGERIQRENQEQGADAGRAAGSDDPCRNGRRRDCRPGKPGNHPVHDSGRRTEQRSHSPDHTGPAAARGRLHRYRQRPLLYGTGPEHPRAEKFPVL